MLADARFGIDNFSQLIDEPGIEPTTVMDLLGRCAYAQGLSDLENSLRRCPAEGRPHGVLVVTLADAFDLDLVEAGQPGFQATEGFLQRFLEGAANGHDFAYRLHGGRQQWLGARELLKSKARDLGDDIIDRRLERCRGRAAGNVVGEFVKRVADCQERGDLGDREAGRLGGKGR